MVDRHRGGHLIKRSATAALERQQPLHYVRWTRWNVRDVYLLSTRGGPGNRRRRRGPVALAGHENYRALTDTGGDRSGGDCVCQRRTLGRTNLADAVEVRVIVLPRQVLTHQPVGQRYIFAPELRGGSHQCVRNYSGSGKGQHTGRRFFVKIAQ